MNGPKKQAAAPGYGIPARAVVALAVEAEAKARAKALKGHEEEREFINRQAQTKAARILATRSKSAGAFANPSAKPPGGTILTSGFRNHWGAPRPPPEGVGNARCMPGQAGASLRRRQDAP